LTPRPRTLAVIAVGAALLVQTWLWIGVVESLQPGFASLL
jgi:hypothetical protein